MYGMPQPNTYGQYGFGGYGGTPTAGAPGMPSPTAAAAGVGMAVAAQPGAADPAAAATQAAQWAVQTLRPTILTTGVVSDTNQRFTLLLTSSCVGYYGQQPTAQQGGDSQGAA